MLIFSPLLLSQDAVRLWTCVWHASMQQQPEETQRKLLLIAKTHTTEEEYQTCVVPWFEDSRWSATPSSQSNPTVRSRHRIVPQRTANVSESPPAQVET